MYPEAVYVQNADGNTPVHRFIIKGYEVFEPFDILHDILRRHPDLAGLQNNTGETIAMLSVRRLRGIYNIPTLIETNPASFLLRNKQSQNVLHIACQSKPMDWWKIAQYVLERHHLHLLFEKDSHGMTPLQYGIATVGMNSYTVAKELFLTTCLKYTPLHGHDMCWNVFRNYCQPLVPIFGILLQRSEAEAARAFPLLPTQDQKYIRHVLLTLRHLEPGITKQILSSCLS
jgi:ankyrin repeat protein